MNQLHLENNMNKIFDSYRPTFDKTNFLRTVDNLQLYSGHGLVPDTKTATYIDYVPTHSLVLAEIQKNLTEHPNSTSSAFCQGCELYNWPNAKIGVITNPTGQVVRITETINQNNFNWFVIPIFFLPIIFVWVMIKLNKKSYSPPSSQP